MQIQIFTDANYGPESVSGVLVLFNRAPVLWQSRRQKVQPASASESELVAMHLGAQTAAFIHCCLKDLDCDYGPIDIFCDNKSAVSTANSDGLRTATRHYIGAQRYVQQQRKDGFIRVRHVPSDQQLADILTKRVTGPKLRAVLSKIMDTA